MSVGWLFPEDTVDLMYRIEVKLPGMMADEDYQLIALAAYTNKVVKLHRITTLRSAGMSRLGCLVIDDNGVLWSFADPSNYLHPGR